MAFTVELTTIPLYLTAMYTVLVDRTNATTTQENIPKDDNYVRRTSEKLLRSVAIDEMKHMFIVSNLINSLTDS